MLGSRGRVFIEIPRLMTDDELIAVSEDFIAEAHGRVAERAQATPKAPAEPPDRPKAALYRRIGIQKNADSGLRVCL
jgi:hypothetical protein